MALLVFASTVFGPVCPTQRLQVSLVPARTGPSSAHHPAQQRRQSCSQHALHLKSGVPVLAPLRPRAHPSWRLSVEWKAQMRVRTQKGREPFPQGES